MSVPDKLVRVAAEALCTPACQADHGRELVEDDCVLEARAALAAAFAKLVQVGWQLADPDPDDPGDGLHGLDLDIGHCHEDSKRCRPVYVVREAM